jgi:hypothetical protein
MGFSIFLGIEFTVFAFPYNIETKLPKYAKYRAITWEVFVISF